MKAKSVARKSIYRHICENLDQDMDSPACREIRKHVRGCTECLDYLNSLKSTVTLYRRYPVPRLSAAARTGLLQILRQKR